MKIVDIFLSFAQNIQKQEKYQTFSAENFQFLKLKKSLFIAWATFRNVYQHGWQGENLSMQYRENFLSSIKQLKNSL